MRNPAIQLEDATASRVQNDKILADSSALFCCNRLACSQQREATSKKSNNALQRKESTQQEEGRRHQLQYWLMKLVLNCDEIVRRSAHDAGCLHCQKQQERGVLPSSMIGPPKMAWLHDNKRCCWIILRLSLLAKYQYQCCSAFISVVECMYQYYIMLD